MRLIKRELTGWVVISYDMDSGCFHFSGNRRIGAHVPDSSRPRCRLCDRNVTENISSTDRIVFPIADPPLVTHDLARLDGPRMSACNGPLLIPRGPNESQQNITSWAG